MENNSNAKENYLKIRSDTDNNFDESKLNKIEPWLMALFQSERLNVLIGSGFTTSQEDLLDGESTNFMELMKFDVFSNQIEKAREDIAKQNGREKPNIEDQINSANNLLEGLKIYMKDETTEGLIKNIEKLKENINENLNTFIKKSPFCGKENS